MYILILFVFMSATALTIYLLAPAETEVVTRKRLDALGPGERYAKYDTLDQEMLAEPFSVRLQEMLRGRLEPLVKSLTPVGIRQRYEKSLVQAGEPYDLVTLVMHKLVLAAGLGLVVLVLDRGSNLFWLVFAAAGGLGFYLPDVLLARRVTERQRMLRRQLPDALDLLVVAVQAGLGFDGAIKRVAEKFPQPTSGLFNHYLKAISVGTPRAEALRGLPRRIDIPELKGFVAGVVQADRLGVSMAKLLTNQAAQIRFQRKQRAHEAALKLPIKMLFPLILFIFPTLFIVLLGPIAIHFMSVFH